MSVPGPHRYAGSPACARDLAVTARVWGGSPVLQVAGVFVFLTYLTLPVLVAVRSRTGGTARSTLDGERERSFLCRLVGISGEAGWRGGIANPRVRRMATALLSRHRRFPGMRPEYLRFVATLVALAPLRVRDRFGLPVPDRSAYWRYMAQALALVGGCAATEAAGTALVAEFVAVHCGPSVEGTRLHASLREHHPRYVTLAGPVLFGPSRGVLAGA